MPASRISAFRIVRAPWAASALDGEGARKYGWRWNPRGYPCVYLADSRALAALEVLVHLTPRTRSVPYQLIEVTVPAPLVKTPRHSRLPTDWQRAVLPDATREFGRRWLESLATPALRLPSAIVEGEDLILLNPRHPAAKRFRASKPRAFRFDDPLPSQGAE